MIDTKKLGILVLPLFFLAGAARAASLPLQWQPVTSPDVRGYRVYYGTASRTYSTSLDAGNTTQYTLSGLTACTRYYVAVKAYNQAGVLSTSFSNEVVGMPTPQVTLVTPATAELGQSLTVNVTGSSFDTGAALSLPAKMSVVSSSVLSCTLMTATISVASDAPAGVKNISVYNTTDLSQGTLASAFNVTAVSAPAIRAVSPAPGGTGVINTVHPAVLFSERMMPSSVNATSIRLLRPDGVLIAHAPGSPALDTTGTIVVITPAAALAYSTSYRINVLGGAAYGVRDAQGTPLNLSYTQSPGFSVVAAPSATGNGTSDTAPDVTARITAGDDPIVDFEAPMDPQSLTDTTLSLIGPWGPVAQERNSPSLDESGRRVTIYPSASLEPGAVYRVRVMGGPQGVRDAQGRSLLASFDTEGFVTAALTPSDQTDQTDEAVPGKPGLWPIETDPADRTADVPVFLRPAVTFSSRMDPVSLSPTTIRILDPDGNEVPQAAGSPILEATHTIATIVPSGGLRPGVAYRIQVIGGADGVRDESGATMDGSFEQLHGFAVEANGVERPDIESTDPSDDDRRVDLSTRPTITFTEPLDPSSVDTTSIELLTANGRAVAQAEGSPVLDGSGTVVTIIPAVPLRGHTFYVIRVVAGPGGVRDFAGRSMPASSSGEIRFRTKAGRDLSARTNDGTGPRTPRP